MIALVGVIEAGGGVAEVAGELLRVIRGGGLPFLSIGVELADGAQTVRGDWRKTDAISAIRATRCRSF